MLSRAGRVVVAIAAATLLSVAAAAADPIQTLTVEDVLRLHRAGVSESVIASEIAVTQTVFYLSVEEILRLKEAGLSEELLQYMVDTALPPGEYVEEEDPEVYVEDGELYADRWVNEIEESPTTVFVSLDYSYPTWWYDFYWYDYWYYDCTYLPYRTSYVWTWGVYYPAWYSYRTCWVPSYWGYRSHTWRNWGYHWNYAHCHDLYYGGGSYWPSHPASGRTALGGTKYRDSGGSGKLLVSGGLKTRDARHLTRDTTELRIRNNGKRRLVADKRTVKDLGGLDGRRPVRTGLAAADGRRLVKPSLGDRPVRPVRKPALQGSTDDRRPIRRPAVKTPTRNLNQDERGVRPVRPTHPDKPTVRRLRPTPCGTRGRRRLRLAPPSPRPRSRRPTGR